MNLRTLLEHIDILEVRGATNREITGIEFDSRKVEESVAFVAQRGIKTDGHNYISKALDQGATAVFCEEFPDELPAKVTFILVENSLSLLGKLAAAFYGFPSQKMKVIGITGTNGKTSIVTLLYRLFVALGYKTGLISTISYRINEIEENASHTTPDALKIQVLMAKMVEAGCDYCFMEVSSHAVHQQRIRGIEFAGAVFTNITH
ncbi:MAG TPA: Mur ligase family protein, partial [Tangfeifania sp.]|nr:Mur ligase family protein [Tangfeifania sp.]